MSCKDGLITMSCKDCLVTMSSKDDLITMSCKNGLVDFGNIISDKDNIPILTYILLHLMVILRLAFHHDKNDKKLRNFYHS